MRYGSASIPFVEQAGLHKATGVLRNGFEVAAQRLGYPLDRNTITLSNEKQYLDPPMIGHAL